MDLTELVRQAQAGDQQAMGQLYEQTSQRVYALALRLTNDPELAMDVVQETYLSALQHLDSLRNPEAFISWMFQIAANRCHRLHKQQGRFIQVSKEEDEDGGFLEAIPDPDEGILPESVADNVETRRLVMELVDQLPEAQRECVILYYFSHCSVDQIAEIQGCAPGTVKSRLNYARKKLKEDVLALEERDGIRLHTLVPIGILFQCLAGELPDPAVFSQTWQAVTAGLGAAGAAGATAAAAAGTQTAGSATAAASAAGGKAAVGTAVKAAASGAFKLKLVAGLAAGGLLVGGVGLALQEPTLSFSDPAFEQNIRTIIDKPQGPIHPSDVELIDMLSIEEDGTLSTEIWMDHGETSQTLKGNVPVNSLEDLALLPHLADVHYDVRDSGALLQTIRDDDLHSLLMPLTREEGQTINDLGFLENLEELKILIISVAEEADLTPLEEASSLVELYVGLSGSSLDLSQLTQLGFLEVTAEPDTYNQLTASETLPNLVILDLKGLDVGGASLDVLSYMPSLEYVGLESEYQMDLTPLSQLKKLRAVHLYSYTYPVDLTPLLDCPSLEICSAYNAAEGNVIPPQLSVEWGSYDRSWEVYYELMNQVRKSWTGHNWMG